MWLITKLHYIRKQVNDYIEQAKLIYQISGNYLPVFELNLKK